MSPLFLLRPLRYERVAEVVLVQTGSPSLTLGAARRVKAVFPGAVLHVVLRGEDAARRGELADAYVDVVRPGERQATVARLRRKRFDVVALLLSDEPLGELGVVPLLLRGRSLVAFNRNLDHFPISLHRLSTIAHHFSAAGDGSASAVRAAWWLVRRAALRLLAIGGSAVYLAAVAAWLHVRGGWRRRARLARGRRAARAGGGAGCV